MPHATVNGIELHYREAGDGFPIVLIHGYTGNLRNWALTVPALTEEFRTISVDLRGHGQSEKPVGAADYSLEALAGDVVALLGQLGVEKCHLVGHSMGGYVAQHLVLTQPGPFRALVLADTAGESLPQRGAERRRLIEIALEQGMEAAFEEQLRITPLRPQMEGNPEFVRLWREQFLMTSREAYIYCAQTMIERPSLLDDLRAVSIPTQVVCGEHDEPFLGPSQRLHEAIPGSELVIIPGAGHSPQFETPAEFNAVVMGFLSKVEESAPVR